MGYAPSIRKILLLAVMMSGCAESPQLMPTPNIYIDKNSKLFNELPPEFTSTQVELIYITDRAPELDDDGNLHYGFNRSNSLAAGTTVIDLGENTSWRELVQASRTQSRIGEFELLTRWCRFS